LRVDIEMMRDRYLWLSNSKHSQMGELIQWYKGVSLLGQQY